jgi:hypothetical protein
LGRSATAKKKKKKPQMKKKTLLRLNESEKLDEM